jgi:hypothetical protein
LLNPDEYAEEFADEIPETTILFFEHLIPDEETREYVLRFILTKLTTMQFSEVILYFLGIQGAGKNLFIDWLAMLTENQADNSSSDFQMVIEVDLENFLAKYNHWIVNALFANLDEYGEKTAGNFEDKKVLAQLKSYTGKENIQLRTMNNDPVPARHKCTFILTANENRLAPDLEDRRIVLIDTPKPLITAEFVTSRGGKSNAIDELFAEQELWCYYWATNYKYLIKDAYRTPPSTDFKKKLIMRHLSPSKKIGVAVLTQNLGSLIELCEDSGMLQDLIDNGKYGAVSKNLLTDLFAAITDGTAARKSMLDKELRNLGLKPVKTRFGSKLVYSYPFPTLKPWASKLRMVEDTLLAGE